MNKKTDAESKQNDGKESSGFGLGSPLFWNRLFISLSVILSESLNKSLIQGHFGHSTSKLYPKKYNKRLDPIQFINEAT